MGRAFGALLAVLACGAPIRGTPRCDASPTTPADLGPLLETACGDGAVAPGGAAVVVREGRVISIGVFGRRIAGEDGALTIDDPIPMSALAAPVTALVCAAAVNVGTVHWTTSIGDAITPDDWAVDVGWRDATLVELASRRVASVEGMTAERIAAAAGGADASAPKCREALLRLVGASPPKTPHGTYDPVNRSGLCFAALVVERASKAPFEDVARRLVFDPLKLSSARFATRAAFVDPNPSLRGHDADGRALAATAPDARSRALAPASGLRISLTDAARLLAALATPSAAPLALSDGASEPLTRTAPGVPAVCGWHAERRPWARGTVYFSGFRGAGWCSTAWIAPKRGYSIVVALNRETEAAYLAAEALVNAVSSDDALSGG